MNGDLTTLDRVKAWLGVPNTSSDVLLQDLIASASDFVRNEIQRDDLGWHAVSEYYDGANNNFMVLRQWPVTKIDSIQFCGVTITTAAIGNPRQNGYLLDPPPQGGGQQRLTLFGYAFPQGRSNVTVNYHAGYLVQAEARNVPATSPYTVTPKSVWLDDQGVTYALTGAAMVEVESAPAVGQYSIDENGTYTFNAADAGVAILMDYSYVPAGLEQATKELVGERYRIRDRIGVVSQGVGGRETTSYSQKDMNSYISSLLRTFKRVTPA